MFLSSKPDSSVLKNTFTISPTTGPNAPTISTSIKQYGAGSLSLPSISSYIYVPLSASLSLASADFTMECWIYPTGTGIGTIMTNTTSSTITANTWSLSLNSNKYLVFTYFNTSIVTITGGTTAIATSAWTNIAVSRNNGNLYLFVNGTIVQTATLSPLTVAFDTGSAPFYIGNGINGITGNIDEFRLTLGYARYIATYTISNLPFSDNNKGKTLNYDPYFQNVSLLLHFEKQIDSSLNNYPITYSPSASPTSPVNTNSKGIGTNTTCVLTLSSTSTYAKTTNSIISLRTQSFTIEGFIYLSASQPTTSFIIGNTAGTSYGMNNWRIGLSSTAAPFYITFTVYNNNPASPSTALIIATKQIVVSTWTHFAVVRNGSTFNMFINGILDTGGSATTSWSGSLDGNIISPISVGSDGTFYFNGSIDEIRITKGIVRYTRNFVTPTLPFPSGVSQTLLSQFKGIGNLYTPILYLDANVGVGTTTWADQSGNGNGNNFTISNPVATPIISTKNSFNYINFSSSSASSVSSVNGIPLALTTTTPLLYIGATYIVFTQIQPSTASIRTLFGGVSGTGTYPTIVSINTGTNYLGSINTSGTFFPLTDGTNNPNFDISTLPFVSSGYNMLVFKQGTSTSLSPGLSFKYNNQSSLNYYSSTSSTLSTPLYSIGGLNSGAASQYWGNIGNVLVYNTLLSDSQINDIYNRFSYRFIYNTLPLSAITVSYNVISTNSTQITIATPGATSTNLSVGSVIQFSNIPAAQTTLNSNAYYYVYSIAPPTQSQSYTTTVITISSTLNTTASPVVSGTQITGIATVASYTSMTVANIFTIIATIAGSNLLQISTSSGFAINTTYLQVGMQVQFSSSIGGIISATTYYITSINDSLTFTVSASYNGQNVQLSSVTSGSANMTVTSTYVILNTSACGNLITCLNTNYLIVGTPVAFGTSIGGLTPGTVTSSSITGTIYYVKSVLSTTTFTITSTAGGSGGTVFPITSTNCCMLLNTNGLTSYYSGESATVTTSGGNSTFTWKDMSQYNAQITPTNNITVSTNVNIYTSNKIDSLGNIIPGLNSFKYLGGTTTSVIPFPLPFKYGSYTIIWVARYAGIKINPGGIDGSAAGGSSPGGTFGSIFTSTDNTWISGFNGIPLLNLVQSGYAQHGNSWTQYNSTLPFSQAPYDSWLIGVDQTNLFRVNGITVISSGQNTVPTGNFSMTVNGGSGIPSDWIIASVMSFNYELSLSSILTMEAWLSKKYTIPIKPCILDNISSASTNCTGAYALFLISNTYIGPTLNIRRSSDNATMDFYADINGNLGSGYNASGQSLASWLSSANVANMIAYITTWYDQSGSGNHATQPTTSSQPVYDLINNYVDFTPLTSSKFFKLPDGTVPSANSSYTVTVRYNTVNSTALSIAPFLSSGPSTATTGTPSANIFAVARTGSTTGGSYVNYWTTSVTTNYVSSSDTNINVINVNPTTVTFKYTTGAGTTPSIYVNTLSTTTSTTSTTGTARISTTANNYIGCDSLATGTNFLNGQLYYLCIFNNSLSYTDRATLEGANPNNIPPVITSLQAYNASYTSFQISWNKVLFPTNYVQISWTGTDGTNTTSSATPITLYNNVTSYSFTGLNTYTTYTVTITPYTYIQNMNYNTNQNTLDANTTIATNAGPPASVSITTLSPTIINYTSYSPSLTSFSYPFITSPGCSSFTISWTDTTPGHTGSGYGNLAPNSVKIANPTLNLYPPYIINNIISNNTLVCNNLNGLSVGTIVQFYGTVFGGIIATTSNIIQNYTIASLPSSTQFTVNTIPSSSFTLTPGYGAMLMSQIYTCTTGISSSNILYLNTSTPLVTPTGIYSGAMVSFSPACVGNTLFSPSSLLLYSSYYVYSISGNQISIVNNAASTTPVTIAPSTYSISAISGSIFTYIGTTTTLYKGSAIQFNGIPGALTGIIANTIYYVVNVTVGATNTTFTICASPSPATTPLISPSGTLSGNTMTVSLIIYMSSGYFSSPTNLTALDTYSVTVTPYTSAQTPIAANPFVSAITMAKKYTMPLLSLLQSSSSPTNLYYTVTTQDTLPSTPAITWSFTVTYSGSSSVNGTVTLNGSTPPNPTAAYTPNTLIGYTTYSLQLLASGFAAGIYSNTSYSQVITQTTQVATITLGFSGITFNTFTITWTNSGFPLGNSSYPTTTSISGNLIISTSSTYSNATSANSVLWTSSASSSITLNNPSGTLQPTSISGLTLPATFYVYFVVPANSYNNTSTTTAYQSSQYSTSLTSASLSVSVSVSATASSYNKATISWTITEYVQGTSAILIISTQSTYTSATSNYAIKATINDITSTTPYTYDASGLTSVTTYYVYITITANSYNNNTTSTYTSNFTTKPYITISSPSSTSSPSSITFNGVKISWTNYGYSSTSATICISTVNLYNNATNANSPVFNLPITNIASPTSYSTTTLSSNQLYYVYITIGSVTFPLSGTVVSFTTLVTPTVSFASPTSTYNSVTFNYTLTGYSRCTYYIYDNNNNQVTYGTSTTTASVSELNSGTLYYIKVYITDNSDGYGNNSGSPYGGNGGYSQVTTLQGSFQFISCSTNIDVNGVYVQFNYSISGYPISTVYVYNNLNGNKYTVTINGSSAKCYVSSATYYYIVITTSTSTLYGPSNTYNGYNIPNGYITSDSYGSVSFISPSSSYFTASFPFTVSYFDLSDNGSYYQLIDNSANNAVISTTNFTNSDHTGLSFNNLTPGHQYNIYVYIYRNQYNINHGISSTPYVGNQVTTTGIPQVSTLSAYATSSSSITVSWGAFETNYGGYIVIYNTGNSTNSGNQTSQGGNYQFNSLAGSTTYLFTVTPYITNNNTAYAGPSYSTTATTQQAMVPNGQQGTVPLSSINSGNTFGGYPTYVFYGNPYNNYFQFDYVSSHFFYYGTVYSVTISSSSQNGPSLFSSDGTNIISTVTDIGGGYNNIDGTCIGILGTNDANGCGSKGAWIKVFISSISISSNGRGVAFTQFATICNYTANYNPIKYIKIFGSTSGNNGDWTLLAWFDATYAFGRNPSPYNYSVFNFQKTGTYNYYLIVITDILPGYGNNGRLTNMYFA